jgi:AraC-like DNA-binding protein
MLHYHRAALLADYIRCRIDAGECGGLSIRCLCREFAASESVLTRSFKNWQGLSVHAFIVREKMNRAKQLLLNGHEPVNLIARQLGYSEPANFSRDFARATGKSPLEFRRCHTAVEMMYLDNELNMDVY